MRTGDPVLSGQPVAEFLDLPLLRGDEPPEAGYVAAAQAPWPGGIAIYGSPDTTGFTLKGLGTAPATIGTTQDDLPAGPAGRFDYGAKHPRRDRRRCPVLGRRRCRSLPGATLLPCSNGDGEWEVVQFKTATLVAPGTYEISQLLRGQGGTEFAMRPAVAAGARFVVLNAALARLDLTAGRNPPALQLAHRSLHARHRRRLLPCRRAHVCRSRPEAAGAGARAQPHARAVTSRSPGCGARGLAATAGRRRRCRLPRTPRPTRSTSSMARS